MMEPPNPDELELALFGPGVGECVILHVGEGEWVVVDSCINSSSKRPVAIEYLESMGINPAEQVRDIILTHWHDDHVGGAQQLLREAKKARFHCSAAINCGEFRELCAASSQVLAPSGGASEFRNVLRLLRERAPTGVNKASIGPNLLNADMSVLQRAGTKDVPGATLHALSPSTASRILAIQQFARLLPQSGTPKRRLPNVHPNDSAVVLWLEFGSIRVLLGSDLETTKNIGCGWSAIVTSSTRPPGKAQIYKVAHHGSQTGHYDGVWDHMLSANPIALVTPYTRSGLPRNEDLNRISTRTSQVYLTSPASGRKPAARSAAVERTLREVTLSRRTLDAKRYVRVRVSTRGLDPQFEVVPTEAQYRASADPPASTR